MPPFADIQSVIDYNDSTSNLDTKKKSCPLHHESPVRKVSFSKLVAEYDIEKASDYSAEERKATWYSIPQLRELKKAAKYWAHKMETGKLDPNDDSWTSRGLEGRTTEGNEEKYKARTASWAAVFLEQCQQEGNEIEDPEFLAEVYREYTTVSQCLARLRGKQDAREAGAREQ